MRFIFVVALSALCLAPFPLYAQEVCPQGRALFSGCVRADVDQLARTRSILMVQRRISISQQLTLPRADRDFLTAGSRSYIR